MRLSFTSLVRSARPAARWRGRGQVPRGRAGAGAPPRPAVGRALHGRRHADRGVGVAQELPAEGRGRGEPPSPGRNGERDFHGEKRSNATHASTTDPDARLYRKGNGQPSRMAFLGHVLMENRNALVVDACLTEATGTDRKSTRLN